MSKHNKPSFGGPFGHGHGHGHGRGGKVEKAKNFKGTMRELISYMKPYFPAMIISFLFAILSTVFMVAGPKISGKAITELGNGFMAKIQGTGSINFERIGEILLFLLGLYGVSLLSNLAQGYLMAGISQKVSYNLRKSMGDKLNRLPFSYFDKQTHGEVLSRFSNDIDTIQQTLSQSLAQMITSVVQFFGFLIMMISISWQMTLMALIVVPLSMFMMSKVVKHSQKYFTAQQACIGDVNGHIEEMYSCHNIVRAFNGEERSLQEFDELNDKLYNAGWKSQFLSGMMQPISMFVGNLGYTGVCILGGYLAINKVINIGDITAFIQYVRNFNQPISQMAQIMNVLQSTAAAAERVFGFLQEDEEEKDVENPVKVTDENGNSLIKGEVTFEDVNFGYVEDKIIINNFTMDIKEGKRVAIVGPTGAGKTTIVKLLMRFYELNGGRILVDGHDIKDYRRSDLRSLFGMVLQDAWLFSGTVMENLRYGRLDATDEEVIHAADMAYVDHFIRTLDHGYDTYLSSDSGSISQGQKQLLTIARAFLADPKILILDEATSSVDTRTELLIQKGMENLMKNRTCFVIAHRLSTIKDADIILVMKDGDIIETGNHEELMKQGGYYKQLYNSQFES